MKTIALISIVALTFATPAFAQVAQTLNDNAQVTQDHVTFNGKTEAGVPGAVSSTNVQQKESGGLISNYSNSVHNIDGGFSSHFQQTPTGDTVLGGSAQKSASGNVEHTSGTPHGGRNDNLN